jgi:hypothetical protein
MKSAKPTFAASSTSHAQANKTLIERLWQPRKKAEPSRSKASQWAMTIAAPLRAE